MLRRYVHGPGSDEPVVWYEGSATSDRRFLHADERGSVIATSNSSGTTLSTNAYDEYGIPKRRVGIDVSPQRIQAVADKLLDERSPRVGEISGM